MTELLNGVEAPSDAELISRVRGGDASAYGELFSRHVGAAQRLARQLVPGPDGDDLVSEAFARTLQALQAGGGPDLAFRAYLLTSLRRLHVDRIRSGRRVQPTEDMAVYDDGEPFRDTVVEGFENSAAAKAFASLPERWQLVLWHLEVEGQKPADVAPLLGMTPNSVSALAYRAREGLRQAFLTMHLADCPTERCRWVNEHLGGYVRGGLSKRDVAKVEEHLDECRRCMAMYLELSEVNSNLAGIIAPLVLGAAAAGYLSGTGVSTSGLSLLLGRARDFVTANSGGVLTGAVAAGVAAVTTTVFVFGGGAPREVVTEADQPVETVQNPRAAAPEPRQRGPRDPDARPLREAGTTEPWAPAGDGAQPVGFTPAEAVAAPAPVPAPLTEPAPPAGAPSADLPLTEPAPPAGAPSVDQPLDEPTPPAGADTPPSASAPIVTELTLAGGPARITDSGMLVFALAGEPRLPDRVLVTVDTASKVTFAGGGTCDGSGTAVTCDLTPDTVAAGIAAMPSRVVSGTSELHVPLAVPGDAAGPVGFRVRSADDDVRGALDFSAQLPARGSTGTPNDDPDDSSENDSGEDEGDGSGDGDSGDGDGDGDGDGEPIAGVPDENGHGDDTDGDDGPEEPGPRLVLLSNECESVRSVPQGMEARAHCVVVVTVSGTESLDDVELVVLDDSVSDEFPRVLRQERSEDTISVEILMPVGQDSVRAQLRLGSDGPVTDEFQILPPTSSSGTPGQAATR